MFARALSLPLALFIALSAAAQPPEPKGDGKYPNPPINDVFIAKRKGKLWRPALPRGAKLLDHDGEKVLNALPGKAVYVETGYLKLISTVPPLKIIPKTYPRIREGVDALAKKYPKLKKKYASLNRVQVAHFFALHLERAMTEAWRAFGTTMQTYEEYLRNYKHGPYMRQPNKFEVFLFSSQSQYLKFADQFTGRNYAQGQRVRSPVSDAVAFLIPPPPGGSKNFNKWVNMAVNNWAHNILMSEVKNSYTLPVWLDIGFAHWMEQREGFDMSTYSFGEGGKKSRFVNGDWRIGVRPLATSRAPSLDTFMDKQTLGEFDGDEHGICFSLVDYMIREHRKGFGAFCRLRREKGKQPQREAFREAFGKSPSVFFEMWKEWVKANYNKAGYAAMPKARELLLSDGGS